MHTMDVLCSGHLVRIFRHSGKGKIHDPFEAGSASRGTLSDRQFPRSFQQGLQPYSRKRRRPRPCSCSLGGKFFLSRFCQLNPAPSSLICACKIWFSTRKTSSTCLWGSPPLPCFRALTKLSLKINSAVNRFDLGLHFAMTARASRSTVSNSSYVELNDRR